MTLQSIVMPLSEFDHDDKGDALYGMFSWACFFLDDLIRNCIAVTL